MKNYLSKINFLLFFYIGIPSLVFLIYSCCAREIRIIGAADVVLMDKDFHQLQSDTIKGSFKLSWNMETEYSQVDFINNFSNMATSCGGDIFLNSIIDSSFTLTNRSEFYYEGRKVSKGVNLAKILNFKFSEYFYFAINVNFDEEFLSKAEFAKEFNIFDLSVKTNDGLELTGKARIYFGD